MPSPFTSRRLGIEALEERELLSLTVGPNVNVTRSPLYQGEGAITIDPTNPKRLFASSNSLSIDNPDGLFIAYSTDAGATWNRRMIGDGTDGFPLACCDPSVSWDSFGNLFLSYLDINDPPAHSEAVLLSVDGGKTFKLVASLNINDQPTITTGPGATAGSGSVWITGNTALGIAAQGAPVTGLGQVGAFAAQELVPNTSGRSNFGDIAVGPNGQVMVTWQEGPLTGAGVLKVSIDADGLGSGGMSAPVTVTTERVGTFQPIPAQSQRTIDSEAGLAWDRTQGAHRGRVYFVYTDLVGPISSADSDIFVRTSDDNGATWSAPVTVDDDTSHRGQFFGKIALDQTTGFVAVAFYDARNDAGNGRPGDTDFVPNDEAQLWGTVSLDGGATFQRNVKISQGTSNGGGISDINQFGDYIGLAYQSGSFYPIWTDNSTLFPGNPVAPGASDMATAQVVVTPAPPPPPPPPPPTVSIADTSAFEGSAGTTPFAFKVSLSFASTQAVAVNYVTANGTALAGSDYTAASGTVTFSPGTTSQTITVAVIGDNLFEPNETFSVALSNPKNATLAKAQGTGTILNDDATPTFNIGNVTVTRNGSSGANAVFTVALLGQSPDTITVAYATADGTAIAGADYVAQSGTLRFLSGTHSQTIVVPIKSGAQSGPKSFLVNLSNPTGATLDHGQAVGTIVFLNPAPVQFIVDDGDQGYSQTGNWTKVVNTLAYGLDYHLTAAGNGSNQANWSFAGLSPGRFQVFVHYVPFIGWASNAPFTVFDGKLSKGTVLVNEKLNPNDVVANGFSWKSLGTFDTNSTSLRVSLGNNANNTVVADAVRIVRLGDTTRATVAFAPSGGSSPKSAAPQSVAIDSPSAGGTGSNTATVLASPAQLPMTATAWAAAPLRTAAQSFDQVFGTPQLLSEILKSRWA